VPAFSFPGHVGTDLPRLWRRSCRADGSHLLLAGLPPACASHRQKQLVWSCGLRAAAGLGAEKTDEEIAAEEDTGTTVAILPARTWRKVYPVAVQLRRVLAEHGREAAYAWLDARSLVYEVVERAARPPPLAA
jgi:hypothetical protein